MFWRDLLLEIIQFLFMYNRKPANRRWKHQRNEMILDSICLLLNSVLALQLPLK